MFEGSKTPLNIFVEIWILQILMSVKLNFWYQQTVYILMAWKDPYGGLQNPYFLELQQKNVAAGENCPYVRAGLQTQEKDLKKLKKKFKEQGEGYFQYCTRREITTLCRWCNYILREKYDVDEREWERFMEKCHPHMCNIKEIAYRYVPRYEKRRLLQKNQLGKVIVNGMLPLILDTIKSLLQSM